MQSFASERCLPTFLQHYKCFRVQGVTPFTPFICQSSLVNDGTSRGCPYHHDHHLLPINLLSCLLSNQVFLSTPQLSLLSFVASVTTCSIYSEWSQPFFFLELLASDFKNIFLQKKSLKLKMKDTVFVLFSKNRRKTVFCFLLFFTVSHLLFR